jgi:hypothetical protein
MKNTRRLTEDELDVLSLSCETGCDCELQRMLTELRLAREVVKAARTCVNERIMTGSNRASVKLFKDIELACRAYDEGGEK